jgi:cysteine desulfurase/selenocysteine lyase
MIDNYPLLKKCTYLNTAYVGLMSNELIHFRSKCDQNFLNFGDQFRSENDNKINTSRELIGDFFGSNISQTFTVSNFSSAIRFALSFIPKNFNFLVLEEDYPSLTDAVEESGFNLNKIPITSNLENDIYNALLEDDIDVIAISLVQYTSGILIDLNFLKEIKKKYPKVLIFGDGTQYLGGHYFKFNNSPFDFIASSGYKWILAGFGNGFFMVSDYFYKVTMISESELYNKVYKGHIDILALESLNYSIIKLKTIDFDSLLNFKNELSLFLKTSLQELNLLDPLISNRIEHSSIYNIIGNTDLYNYLIKNNIRCAQRGKGVRVSVHFYNTKNDIENLIKILKKRI